MALRWPSLVMQTRKPPLLSSSKGNLTCSRFLAAPTSKSFSNTVYLRRNPSSHSCISPNVKSGEAEGKPRADEIMFDEQTLQQQLDKAIEDEDYAHAAKLRDNLQVLHEDSRASVLSANERFYHAFRNGNLAAMQSIWAKGDHVYVVHPGAGRISGYELVTDSWEIVCGADHEFPIRIDLKDVEVHVRGNVGFVTCMEVVKTKGGSWGKQVATNVFEEIDGQWFICVHHASHSEE
ncbi:uncharacterized protein LOC110019392 [Phalaenopsis equestris]|uniref:uncharacterized protein LOC110019392 n=1 Tax=Phalaenopsis equestris TaxID=78828 RepID=UPI0009E645FC|nr:uncharacterized protein LOC110019392 [Phalaenopsis equestris]